MKVGKAGCNQILKKSKRDEERVGQRGAHQLQGDRGGMGMQTLPLVLLNALAARVSAPDSGMTALALRLAPTAFALGPGSTARRGVGAHFSLGKRCGHGYGRRVCSAPVVLSAFEAAGGASKKPRAKKRRVDELLVEQGFANDAKHAAALVMAGAVIADGSVRVTSAAAKVAEDTPFRLKGQKPHPWVSRGGMKLEHALQEFNIDVAGAVAVDVGCSTGGFTHVLLQNSVAQVYAVDVGYGQLALALRQDPRVVVMERTNARHLNATSVPTPPNLVVCDASFIPLRKVLPASLALCRAPAVLLALIKPQFEAERHEIESGTGVVRDGAVHDRVCSQVEAWLFEQGWQVKGLTKSPITGPNGNVEFIIWASLEG